MNEGISDLTIERAYHVLKSLRVEDQDSFVGKLANMSLFLMDGRRSFEQLPTGSLEGVGSDLKSSFEELIGIAAKSGSDVRRTVFFVFFFLTQLKIASSFYKQSFSNSDVELRQFIFTNKGEFTAEESMRIEHLFSGLPRELLLEHAQRAIASFNEEIRKAIRPLTSENEKTTKSLEQLAGFSARADKLGDLVRGHAEKLDFIGLSRGFEKLIIETNSALRWPVVLLFFVALLMIAVPLATLAWPFFITTPNSQWWQISAPALAIEFVLIYLFRVVLLRYQSLKAQLLQLKLRFSLCAFVESYAEFAGRIRKGPEDKVLDKFEALIFSGITPDPQNVPSQFDGLDQLANLLKSMRSGSGT